MKIKLQSLIALSMLLASYSTVFAARSSEPLSSLRKETPIRSGTKAYLKLLTDPDVDCFINEVLVERKSENIELPPGQYKLKFVKQGFPVVERIVSAQANRITVVSIGEMKQKETVTTQP